MVVSSKYSNVFFVRSKRKERDMPRLFIIAGVVLLGVIGLSQISAASGYKVVPVKDGGTITGKVILEGPIPPPRLFPLAFYPFGSFCEKNKTITDGKGNVVLKDISAGPDGSFGDVVVIVEGVTRGKQFKPIVDHLLARGCEFLPFVSVVQNPGTLTMKNEDPILHNGQVYQTEKGNQILNFPIMPNAFDTYTITFERDMKIFKMICGMHEFMQTWGIAVDNPYYALTGSDGKFSIDELPPGTYEVVAWRPHFKPIEHEITVSANGTVSLNFEFDASQVIRPEYERQEKFRMGP